MNTMNLSQKAAPDKGRRRSVIERDSEGRLRAALDLVILEHHDSARADTPEYERSLLDVRMALNEAIRVGRRGR